MDEFYSRWIIFWIQMQTNLIFIIILMNDELYA